VIATNCTSAVSMAVSLFANKNTSTHIY